ncbi:MAG: S41 family peptidase [Gammaproteobacteria bacterium]|nr:S41 family peptidase [Gammaproteobacteria bacterium]
MEVMEIAVPTLMLLIATMTCHGASNEARTISDQQWTADLQQLATSIKTIHFKPFHVLPEVEFNAAVEQLESQIPELSEREIIVRMAEIVARLGDGHTRLHIPRLYPELALPAELGHSGTKPPKFDSLKFRQSPVRFQLFSDGLFVVAATPRHRDLIGQKVLSFDETPVDEAIEASKLVSFFENESRAKLMAPDRLALPDVIHILGISASSELIELTTVDHTGHELTTALQTLNDPKQSFVSDAPPSLPLWLARRSEYRWYEILSDSDAIYVQVNEFEENPATPYGDFVAETLEAARKAGVSRYVIDLRHNFGGVGAWVTSFVTGLGSSEFNEYGRLYVLVGRTTFSAAQFFMHKFEELTYAMFVGEPSGAKPSHFGDGRRIVLENSGLTLRVSTIYWHSWLTNDFRAAINPHLSAPISSSDYFNGFDPVLDAALRYKVPGSLAMQINEQFRQGKNQNALLLFQRYMSDGRIRNHKKVIPDLLAMADKLVEDGLVQPGYFVYFLANASYPNDPDIESGLARIKGQMK